MALLAFSIERISDWMSTGGYVALFGLLFACGLGLPLPEDIPLIIAGAMISQGKMTWLVAGICAWCGIIGGDIVLYHFGKKFGLEITRVPFIGKHVTRERIQRVEQLFDRYGWGVVAVGRLLAGIRGAMVVCAGAIRFNLVKFLIADGLAALVSGGMFMLIGHWLGGKLFSDAGQKFIHQFKEYFFVGGVVLVIGLIVFIVWRKRHGERVIEAEAKIVEKVVETAKKIPHPTHAPKPAKDDAAQTTPQSSGSVDPSVQHDYASSQVNESTEKE